METDTYIIEKPKTEIDHAASLGEKMRVFIDRLFPICRSITGNGVRRTLDIISELISVDRYEIPTGTPVFDWEVPREWNIREAWIKDSNGNKILDFADNNLHVLNYSVAVHKTVPLIELRQHLFTIPDQPDLVPYRTSYYQENWGFCMRDRQMNELPEGDYEVFVDATLEKGYMTFGEFFVPGETTDEVLISTHICHPSLANDNLSGIAVAAFLAQELSGKRHRYSYRFLFIPGTIGAITWLSLNERRTKNIKYGLVASLLGKRGPFTYKRSRTGHADIDVVVEQVLKLSGVEHEIRPFTPYGYDERQFCSPGFNLPVGALTRTTYAEYPEYHTSADNMSLMEAEVLEESLEVYRKITTMIEANRRYLNVNPKCEPQLGKRGLYSAVGGDHSGKDVQIAMLWMLNYSDGSHTVLDICGMSRIDYSIIQVAIRKLVEAKLLIAL